MLGVSIEAEGDDVVADAEIAGSLLRSVSVSAHHTLYKNAHCLEYTAR